MLQLKHIKKVYGTQGADVVALRDINLTFRRSEFVSILGQSGCGKTTLLNVIGGLDHYTSGDLVIENRSTKEFRDADWDAYRNHSIGFVFQSYNLIPHQSVLANVELALTLSGVSRAERRARAREALCRVGLGDQLHKKPNQMSGGQMQRVAIARALVNNPEILLADEPTGALDSATSVQIMEILKEISTDRLVIMVTHNPELAEQYSTRIIRLLDGQVVGDSNPCTEEEIAAAAATPALSRKEQKKRKDPKTRHTSMSFFTALGLSFHNLMTKKARTFLTSFAGSIGIIGIALILSVSQGVQLYINSVQQETLTAYPITLKKEQVDISGMLGALMGEKDDGTEHEDGKIYSSMVMYRLLETFFSPDKQQNNLGAFRKYMEAHPETFGDYTTALQYVFKTNFNVYTTDVAGNTVIVDAAEVFNSALGDVSSSSMMTSYSSLVSSSSTMEIWSELIAGKEDANGNRAPVSPMLKEQYELLDGKWPEAANEVVLIVNSRHEISDMVLYALGLRDRGELSDILAAIMTKSDYTEIESESWEYRYLRENIGLSLVLPTDFYTEVTPAGADRRLWAKTESVEQATRAGLQLNICGIIAPAEGSTTSPISGALGYTYHLTDYIIDRVMQNEMVQYQMLPENENYDVLTGLPFVRSGEDEKTDAEKRAEFLSYVANLSAREKYDLLLAISATIPEAMLKKQVDGIMAQFRAPEWTEDAPVYDRAKMEKMIKDNFSAFGVQASADLVEKYIARLSDEELANLIRSAAESAAKEQYSRAAKAQVEEMLDTVMPAELEAYKAAVLSGLTTKEAKIYYLSERYTALTSLPKEAYLSYLMGCDDAQLDALLDDLLTIEGNTYLAGRAKEEAYRATKAAAMLDARLAALPSDSDFAPLYDAHMPSGTSKSTLAENLENFGVVDRESPDEIVIYVATFEDKEKISAGITAYNSGVSSEGDKIQYTDYVGLLMSSVTTIIDAISYVLIAFVAISLVVSSIMIGIITYISVLERTKEIGILRAIGASKRDISGVFNAETLTIGFVSGGIGIAITLFFVLIINIILHALTGIPNLNAVLPWKAGVALVAISMFLTFIAGLVPSRIAAKKDPVIALRTE